MLSILKRCTESVGSTEKAVLIKLGLMLLVDNEMDKYGNKEEKNNKSTNFHMLYFKYNSPLFVLLFSPYCESLVTWRI